jgi:DNA-binding NarL/FixJ family response regulator
MPQASLHSVKVAVVERQLLLRELLVSVLGEAGFEPFPFSSLEQLLARAGAPPPAVALLGLHPERLPSIRDVHERHPDMGLVVLSEAPEPSAIEACYKDGASGFLDRTSAQRASVVDTVRAVARGERVFPMGLLDVALLPPPLDQEPDVLRAVSRREREVLRHVAAGLDNLKIGAALQISERTVKAHVTSLYRKLGSENRTQLALEARRLGIRPLAGL